MRTKDRATIDATGQPWTAPETAPGKRAPTDRMVQRAAAPTSTAATPAGRMPPVALVPDQSYLDSIIGSAPAPVQQQAEASAESADVHGLAAAGIGGASESLPFLDVIQASFGGHDVSGVQAHTDEKAASAAAGMGATAFATGDHIAFAQAPDLHTAAHEAAHVVQQRAGVQLKGGVGTVGDTYEGHADDVADAVVSGESAQPILDQMAGGRGDKPMNAATQRKVIAPAASEPLAESIRYLEERAAEALGGGKPGPRVGDQPQRTDDLASAADMVTDQLAASEGDLAPRIEAALRNSVARMAEVGLGVGGDGALALRLARERLALAASRRGLDVRAPIAAAGGIAPLGGEADDAKLLDGLERRIGLLVESLAIHAESPDADRLVAPVADAILALMNQAEGVIRGADTRDMERFSQQVLRISAHAGLLFRRARGAQVSLLATSLPDVFEHEDRLLRSVGAASALRFAAFHGDQRADKDNPATSGEALIESIIDQLTNSAAVHQSAIAVVASALQEPEASPPPSLLEEVMLTVVSDLIGGLPGHFGRVLDSIGKAVGNAGDGGSADAKSKSLLSGGLFNTAKKIVSFGAGEAKQGAKESIATVDGKASASMKTRFITDCHVNTIAYMAGPLHDQARHMQPLLQRVPPDQLKLIHEMMTEGLKAMFPHLIQDLLAQWMNFRAGIALGGVTADGDLAMNGPLKDVVERPGSVKVSVGLRGGDSDHVDVLGFDVDGVGPAVLRELSKGPKVPLTSFPVHRHFTLMGPQTAGGRKMYGSIDLNAGGALRVDGVHDRGAVASTGRHQPTVDPTDADVEEGARRVLASVPLTTKDLA